ncbi:hypothetical protein DTG00_14865 [Salmonella enterica subsp. enterica]|uniref:hypothetical protein n=1 Tax=Salmonella enterica TaxID=28901 RepID=UPI00093F4511|nr:hypothetical protein [Salmonella enterica]AXD03719.1 hypothetical protein LFZ28_06325 [Salmonella enterica subsp. enterica serovar Milwaukee str. SA19950795]EBI3670703.1 hypothetical protein [Salmonella enterica]MJY56818.1 hypothetical protein [Salmonella enterica subsp. enterica serovar Milwaukee]
MKTKTTVMILLIPGVKYLPIENRILLRENNARLQDSGKELNKNNVCKSFYISLNGRPDKRERHPAWQILSGFNR